MTIRSHSKLKSWDYLAQLRRIVAIWPKPEGGEPADFQLQLAPFLAADFDPLDFVNKIVEVSEIAHVVEHPTSIQVEFYDVDDCLHRAVFIPRDGSAWTLQSLKFQCSVCFGSGINDDLPCQSCGGTGWGVS